MKNYNRFLLLFFLTSIFLSSEAQVLTPIVDSIPLRDGKMLAADIYLPDESSGEEYPVILIQTPYNRLLYRYRGLPMIGFDIENSDYAFVILDWRCFYGSFSACIPNPNRGEDGYDAVEWIAQQDWSNDKIGTWGLSALGKVQFQTAREQPPHLVCCIPLVAGPQMNYLQYFPGGVIRTEYVETLDALGFGLSSFLYNNVIYDTIWGFTENATFYPSDIEVPMFMIGGWFDHNNDVVFQIFEGLREESPAEGHKLLFGPWTHGDVGDTIQGDLSFAQAAIWSDSLSLMFFDHLLLEESNGWEDNPAIRFYQPQSEVWRSSNIWPPDNTVEETFYLNEGHTLSLNSPANSSAYDSLIYDPRDPSPTIGGPTLAPYLLQGPYDQDPDVESRGDILIFTSDSLQEDFILNGNPRFKVFFSSNRKDTDIAVRLTDVFPDGKSILVLDGIKRARFRNGYRAEDTSLIQPGEVYEMEIEMLNMAYTFKAGHRIRLDITSSNYPRFDCNLNNGGEMYASGDSLIATNKIYFNTDYPSHLILPKSDTILFAEEAKKSRQAFIRVYPNPTKNVCYVEFYSDGKNQTEIKLLNTQGSMLRSWFTNPIQAGINKIRLDLTDMKPGLCFLYLNLDGQLMSKKIIIH